MNWFYRRSSIWMALALAGATAGSATAAPSDSNNAATPTTTQAPTASTAQTLGKKGELGTQDVKGVNKEKLDVGKFDPPAAFNLEDIQNFPEDRLMPVLHNPITFEEGRDFSVLMDFQEEQLYHPWLPEIGKAPFLVQKAVADKAGKDWSFAIIDQAGATVAKQDGHGEPPASIAWNGEDSVRDMIAVETVYIPQLSTTDKEGYHHTYMGQPIQYSAITYKDHGHDVIELSSKRLFQEKKSDFTKEAPIMLDKLTDALREDGLRPFSIQPYDADSELGRDRQKMLKDYLVAHLHISADQISTPDTQGSDKRGAAMSIQMNSGGG